MTHWTQRDPEAVQDFDQLIIDRDKRNHPYVYFIAEEEDASRVRIGWSGNGKKWKRIDDHRKGGAFPKPLTVLATVRGRNSAETAIHNYFLREYDKTVSRDGNSVYTVSDRLLSYIVWLRDQVYVSTTEKEFQSDTGQTIVDQTFWLPSPEKQSPRRSHATLLIHAEPWAILPSRDMTGDDWYTDESIIIPARAALGGNIDLDPASHVHANAKVIHARRFFSVDEDGLQQQWIGDRVWLNPPFAGKRGTGGWADFATKALEEIAAGRCRQLVMLGATRMLSAQYARAALERADALSVLSGRIAFWGIQAGASPVDGWFLLYFGQSAGRFRQAFAEMGPTWGR